jgi:hypothetical protein
MEGAMSDHQKIYVLGELRQLHQAESRLRVMFKTLGTAPAEARVSFVATLQEWQLRAQVLDNLLDNL